MPCPLALLVCRGSDCEKRPCDGGSKGGAAFFRACERALGRSGAEHLVALRATKCQDHCKDGRIVLVRHDGHKTTLGACNSSETAAAIVGALATQDGWASLESHRLTNVKARRKAAKERRKRA